LALRPPFPPRAKVAPIRLASPTADRLRPVAPLAAALFAPVFTGPMVELVARASPLLQGTIFARVRRPRALLALLLLPGCSPVVARGGGYCAPPSAAAFALDASDPRAGTSQPDGGMAALLGLGDVTVEQTARSPDVRLRVLERVQKASLAIDATSAELDCEGERAEQAADYLTRGQATSVQALTVGSVVVATLTSIAGVLLSTKGRPALEQDVVAISGGVVTAGLGLGSLLVHPRTEFDHERNLLADVWLGPTASVTYPPVVWAYLSRPEFSNTGREAIRKKIVSRWQQFRQVDDPSTAATFFGRGGSYDAEALRSRAAMLDEVKAEVELAHQDLATLAATLLR
jgi:hypothetical protein